MQHSELYNQLFNFMLDIINCDDQAIASICTDNSELFYKDNHLIFMINGLYAHLMASKNSVDKISYLAFRHLLYSSDLNSRLAEKGYVVSVYSPSSDCCGKVDTTWYVLEPIGDS